MVFPISGSNHVTPEELPSRMVMVTPVGFAARTGLPSTGCCVLFLYTNRPSNPSILALKGSILKFVFGSGYWFLSFCAGASPGAKNRSPNTMANWFIAACQCCAGTFHPRTMFRKAKYISLAAASSLGK